MKKTIFFWADGRLGNQLFQYAFLATLAGGKERVIALRMQQLTDTFDIDNSWFRSLDLSPNILWLFTKIFIPYILTPLANIKMIGSVCQEKQGNISLPRYKVRKGLLPFFFVKSAFFQSDRFFDVSFLDLAIKKNYTGEAEAIFSSLPKNKTKVFVHIRRGDYLTETFAGEKGIALPKSYYEEAIRLIQEEVPDSFFVFISDDPDYVECCYDHIKNKYISRNSMQIDLTLMTLCKYGITSNSSFSWWGAFLMENRKQVFFPKYWYGWKKGIESHIDIHPSWAKILEIK